MFCPKCRTENPSEALSCICCGAALGQPASEPAVTPGSPAYAIPSPQQLASGSWGASASLRLPRESEENTSGWGQARPAPSWTRGWSFAGALPFGLFAFYGGSQSLGLIGVLLTLFGLPFVTRLWPFVIGYVIYLGFKGREVAWRGRRFAGRQQYERTMHIWNIAGAVAMIIVIMVYVIWVAALLSNPGGLAPLSNPAADASSYT